MYLRLNLFDCTSGILLKCYVKSLAQADSVYSMSVYFIVNKKHRWKNELWRCMYIFIFECYTQKAVIWQKQLCLSVCAFSKWKWPLKIVWQHFSVCVCICGNNELTSYHFCFAQKKRKIKLNFYAVFWEPCHFNTDWNWILWNSLKLSLKTLRLNLSELQDYFINECY